MSHRALLDLLRDVAELRNQTPSAIARHALGQRAAVLLNELRRDVQLRTRPEAPQRRVHE